MSNYIIDDNSYTSVEEVVSRMANIGTIQSSGLPSFLEPGHRYNHIGFSAMDGGVFCNLVLYERNDKKYDLYIRIVP